MRRKKKKNKSQEATLFSEHHATLLKLAGKFAAENLFLRRQEGGGRAGWKTNKSKTESSTEKLGNTRGKVLSQLVSDLLSVFCLISAWISEVSIFKWSLISSL